LQEIEEYVDPQVIRDGGMSLDGHAVGLTAILIREAGGTEHPLWSRVPNGDLMKAALHALNCWLATGEAPPHAPRLAIDPRGKLIRDAEGRVLGGIRYAAYDVPMARNVGVTEQGCRLAGYHVDFTRQELRQRYGHTAEYLARVKETVDKNVTEGSLLPEDADRVLEEARAAAAVLPGEP
jgi:hypothetical protein